MYTINRGVFLIFQFFSARSLEMTATSSAGGGRGGGARPYVSSSVSSFCFSTDLSSLFVDFFCFSFVSLFYFIEFVQVCCACRIQYCMMAWHFCIARYCAYCLRGDVVYLCRSFVTT